MLIRYRGWGVVALLSAAAVVAVAQQKSDKRIAYPPTAKGDFVETLAGKQIADPYRWMEDLDSPDLKSWIAAENAVTQEYLRGAPAREAIGKRLTKLWDYERFGMPVKRGNRYFYSHNDGLQNQSVLFVADSLTAAPRELLDPNKLAKDGTMALASTDFTDDGKLLAYGLSAAGSDWREFRVRDVATGNDLPDTIKWAKFSGVSWTKDGAGFFYSRYDEPQGNQLSVKNYYQKLFFHKLGTPQSADVLVCEDKTQPEWSFEGNVTDDGKYLIIEVGQGTEPKNRVYFKDLTNPGSTVVKLIDTFDAEYSFIDNDGGTFWFKTDLTAPRGRVIAVDISKPDRAAWKEVIPQAQQTLQRVSTVGGMLTATYLKDAHTQMRMFDLTGKPAREVTLPGLGTAFGFGGKRSETETFYSYTSFNMPPTIYRYDMTTHKSEVYKQAKVAFDPAQYETKQVFYKSKDGTQIPMFLTHKTGLKLDGTNPTMLYGYGGFNQSITPSFSVTSLVWMELGGVYAVANIRGGGEYGREWHDAGRLEKKQNVFDDFIAAAEWLITNKYTSTPKLAISGASNGGLLVGACLTQRPDLFGAALPNVGVLDMPRYTESTIGWGWKSDYGDPKDPKALATMLAYSPLHNVKPGTRYPATFITTGDHDDRVVPWHSFKFAAALQAAQASDAPVLIRIETRAGHGAGKPTAKIIEETADRWAFLTRALNMDTTAFVSTLATR